MLTVHVLVLFALLASAGYVLFAESTGRRKLRGLIPLAFLIGPPVLTTGVGVALALVGVAPSPAAVEVAGLLSFAVQVGGVFVAIRLVGTAKVQRAVARLDV